MMRRDPFQAIADPNRRAILALIARESMNLNTVASHFSVSRPAISKHIKILCQCGLVEIRQKGRERYCEARLERLSEVVAWLEDYRSQWSTEIQTETIATIPAPQKEATLKPLAEVSVTKEEPIAAAHVTVETIAAIEIGETITEIMEEPETSVVDTPEAVAPETEIGTTLSQEEVIEEEAIAEEKPELIEIATEEVDLSPEPSEERKPALIPWEDGYIETEDTTLPEPEIDLSEPLLVQEVIAIAEKEPAHTTPVEPNSDIIQVDKILVAAEPEAEPEIQPEPEIIRPVTPIPTRKPARKKKESPPTDSLQGSLF